MNATEWNKQILSFSCNFSKPPYYRGLTASTQVKEVEVYPMRKKQKTKMLKAQIDPIPPAEDSEEVA
jgi:hypothetical protein